MSSQVAENYQLKWHSHLTNLNTSVATLFKNEKFADVLLLTSGTDEGNGIPAHKIILSSCSHYFASIFDTNPSPPNSLIYVILPADLSKRAMQILVQYMYSGEATVSNDILNEVLRGGELLKIRGLWRNSGHPNNITTSSSSSGSTTHGDASFSQQAPIKIPPKAIAHQDIVTSPMEKLVYDTRQDQYTNGIYKESPVIVMSSHHQQSQQQQTVASTIPPQPQPPSTQTPTGLVPTQMRSQQQSPSPHHAGPLQSSSMQNIVVKKEAPPEHPSYNENRVPSVHYGLVSLQIAAAVKKAQQHQPPAAMQAAPERRFKPIHQENGNERVQISREHCSDERLSDIESGNNPRYACRAGGDNDQVARLLQHAGRRHSYITDEMNRRESCVSDAGSENNRVILERKPGTTDMQIPEALSFLTIKQEPMEWLEYAQENGGHKPHVEVTVKPEIDYAEESGEDEVPHDHDELVYSPLTCELCSETFIIPGDWVRHIESHTETTHCVPKKRKRLDETNSDNTASLRCDLCAMYFLTPAEWVRHVQNTHTETELALSNNSSPPKRNVRTPRPAEMSTLEKQCSVCNKTFPSYASMVIHKRTHTGERPFYCSLCNKGFNVKSNLLRHMRTLHNQLLNPSNLNDIADSGGGGGGVGGGGSGGSGGGASTPE